MVHYHRHYLSLYLCLFLCLTSIELIEVEVERDRQYLSVAIKAVTGLAASCLRFAQVRAQGRPLIGVYSTFVCPPSLVDVYLPFMLILIRLDVIANIPPIFLMCTSEII